MIQVRKKKRRVTLMSVPDYVRDAYARAYPEIDWAEQRSPGRPERWEELTGEFRAPFTPLCLAAMPYSVLPAYMRRGWLKPLDEALPPEVRALYASAALQMGTIEGRLYSVPDDVSVFALAIRHDLLKKVRLKPPRTWKDLEESWRGFARLGLRTLCMADGKGIPGRTRLLLAMLGANGVNPMVGWDGLAALKAQAVETYEWMRRMASAFGPADPFCVSIETMRELQEGGLPSALVDTGFLCKLPPEAWKKFKVVSLPLGPSCRQAYGYFMGSGWVMPNNAVAPDLGFDVLATMREPGLCADRELSGGWGFPAVMPVWKDPRIQRRFPFYREARVILGASRIIEPARMDMDLWTRAAEAMESCMSEGADGEAWWDRVMSSGLRRAQHEVSHHLLRRAVEFIDGHLAEIDGVKRVAASVNRHHDYLNQLFRKHLKVSCGEYLKRRRMERARELLSDMTLTIKEIAAAVGMRNLSSFSRAFRDYWGCNATIIRSRLGEPSPVRESEVRVVRDRATGGLSASE